MSRRYLIDTNTVSAIVKGKSPAARAKLATLKQSEIACISTIIEAEIHYGLHKMRNPESLRRAIENFLAKIKILRWDRAEAVVYGELRATLEAAGNTLGNLDMLIAAHAIAVGATLVTNDKAFSQVADLRGTLNWATDL